MSYMFVMGPCACCGYTFTYNADKVPSVRVKGTREPICLACVNWANQQRKNQGLPEIPVLPGAYEAEEVEL